MIWCILSGFSIYIYVNIYIYIYWWLQPIDALELIQFVLGCISLNWGNNYRFGYEQRYRLKPNRLYYINIVNSHYKTLEDISSHLYNYEKCFAQNNYCQSLIWEVNSKCILLYKLIYTCRPIGKLLTCFMI